MRSVVVKAFVAALLLFVAQAASQAATLQVEPVLVEVMAPGTVSTVTLRNDGDKPINAQIRVFRWVQLDGQEKLEPTDEVVASPPATILAPQGTYVVRIVRTTKRPVSGEENYRLLIDQLPDPTQQRNGTVNFLMRYSIPVFFGTAGRTGPAVAWSVARSGDKVTLTAHNSGERRLRVSALSLRDAQGKTVSLGNGLVGYVLGRSNIQWKVPTSARAFAASGPIAVSAQSDVGPVHAMASVSAGR
jgi:fimbrial chaperone protein